MFYILSAVLGLGPRRCSDGLQNTVEVSCERDIWTTSYEVLMARIAALTELPLRYRRKSQETGNDQGHDASPNARGIYGANP